MVPVELIGTENDTSEEKLEKTLNLAIAIALVETDRYELQYSPKVYE